MRHGALRQLGQVPRAFVPGTRGLSSSSRFVKVSEEVRDAIESKRPVVALETTIYTHGFPYPENVELASSLEATVRVHGAVPATIGIIDGVSVVGMSAAQIGRLVEPSTTRAVKVSRRDLGWIHGLGIRGARRNGGTTVAGTMVLAHLAGIKVFATGGLGGVHRGGELSMDVSADLTELSRTPVAVVSSGCKSFLDIPRTLEFLETQGVGVATFSDGQGSTVDFPGFWTRESGVKSPKTAQNEEEAAAIIYAQFRLPLTSGLLFGNPIAPEHSIPKDEIDGYIWQAVQEAQEEGVSGGDNTPYVLRRIKELSHGKSVVANRALVDANAVRGSKIAVALSRLERKEIEQPRQWAPRITRPPRASLLSSGLPPADVLVAGSVALDLVCDYAPFSSNVGDAPQLHTSNPATIHQSLGGVGHNVASAARLLGTNVCLCTYVGADIAGRSILASLEADGQRTDGIKLVENPEETTAQYVAINDVKKNLVLGMADMVILERACHENFAQDWQPLIDDLRPSWLVVDANWDAKTLRSWVTRGKAVGANVAFEPVSKAKSARLFGQDNKDASLGVYPKQHLDLTTPNAMELAAMHEAARETGHFERPEWWEVVDSFGLSPGRGSEQLTALTSRALVEEGIPQQCIQLLPFMPTVLVKLGPHGVFLAQLLQPADSRLSSPESAPFILSRWERNGELHGLYLRHFAVPEKVDDKDVVSVNGVGDTFLGTLIAGLTKGENDMETLIERAQRGSIMTLKCKEAVHPKLGELVAKQK